MKRADRMKQRRLRALEALKKDRAITQERITTLENDLAAFNRNERSLDRPPVCVERDLQELRREMDRQDTEIQTLTHDPKADPLNIVRRGQYTLANYLKDMESF